MRRSPFATRMTWHDLLFAHWRVAPERLRPLVPRSLAIDGFDGTAWLGVVPFRMTRVGPNALPPLPWGSAFPELNVRTYVTHEGRPGVWFFSLDAADRVAVRVARRFFHLPYHDARMSSRRRGDWIEYRCRRLDPLAPAASFAARYRPVGPSARAPAGTLDHWLTERYSLYAADPAGGLHRGDVRHAPWPLSPAEAEIGENRMTEGLGLPLAGPPVHLRFARRVDVLASPLVRVG